MYHLTMIIPAFNVDDCLDTAMDSIINQTIGFENIEVIIVVFMKSLLVSRSLGLLHAMLQ